MASVVALSTAATIALVAAAVVALGFAGALVAVTLRGRRRRAPDIPPGMKPGPSDDALERRNLETLMGWGIAFTLIFAVNVALVWLFEPATNLDDAVELISRSEERGRMWYEVADEDNPTGFGCAACHGENLEGGVTTFTQPNGEISDYPVPSLRDVCGGEARGHPQIASVDDIRETIMQGRPGTPMPSWSVRFAGPMNDQQIQDLINYIISVNEQTIPEKENICINPPTGTETGGGAGVTDEATPAEEVSPGEAQEETPGGNGQETPAEEETGQ